MIEHFKIVQLIEPTKRGCLYSYKVIVDYGDINYVWYVINGEVVEFRYNEEQPRFTEIDYSSTEQGFLDIYNILIDKILHKNKEA